MKLFDINPYSMPGPGDPETWPFDPADELDDEMIKEIERRKEYFEIAEWEWQNERY